MRGAWNVGSQGREGKSGRSKTGRQWRAEPVGPCRLDKDFGVYSESDRKSLENKNGELLDLSAPWGWGEDSV